MRELLDKKGKRKKKREEKRIIDHVTGTKKARNVSVVLQRFLANLNESWFQVWTARHGVNEGVQFLEKFLI